MYHSDSSRTGVVTLNGSAKIQISSFHLHTKKKSFNLTVGGKNGVRQQRPGRFPFFYIPKGIKKCVNGLKREDNSVCQI